VDNTTGQTADNVQQGAATEAGGEAPYPGSRHMPQWEVGPLGTAPRFGWRQLPMLIGPGLVMGASAIGGGEWLTGPVNTARYGGAILWLATLSIVGQTLYNIEISRYALYTGEPIFTGKFRIKPGPVFWLPVYLLLDFGTFFPYLAAGAAVPLLTMWLGHLPEKADLEQHAALYKALPCLIFVAAMFPLLVGGKVYNSIKVVMATKLVVVLGFLAFLALFYSSFDTWREIISGFFKFGTVPVKNPSDPSATQNIFTSLLSGGGWPDIDFSTIGMLAAMAAIAGNGGLTNTPISNYTRDQGWGMGKEVGAIPSIIGGHTLHLSHVGKVFRLTAENLAKWKGWVRHISRDQLMVWMPACFVGLALPSMLSVEFLERGTVIPNKDLASVMTAGGVQEAVGEPYGRLFWYLTLVCGFLVLGTSMVSTVDGVLRRWVDVFWTAIPRLRQVDPRAIGRVYFIVLCVYATFGITLLLLAEATALLKISTNIYNWALGFSCWHTIAVGTFLLPKELRPSLLRRCGLFAAGLYFLCIACLSTAALTSDKDIAPLIERVKGLF
jgi:hypothetical protein